MKRSKPTVYIASPYTKGDAAINTRFQCEIFDMLLSTGKVLPVAPLWSHFQHTIFPRRYRDWVEYDNQMIELYDCCLRLDVYFKDGRRKYEYSESASLGADAEVDLFRKLNKPVFFSVADLMEWVILNK
jgi:hypothetical protein